MRADSRGGKTAPDKSSVNLSLMNKTIWDVKSRKRSLYSTVGLISCVSNSLHCGLTDASYLVKNLHANLKACVLCFGLQVQGILLW